MKGKKEVLAVAAVCVLVAASAAGVAAWHGLPGASQGTSVEQAPGDGGVVELGDYRSVEEYAAALFAERNEGGAAREYERVCNGDGTSYDKGRIEVTFYRSCGERRAREVVSEVGGEWCDDTFGWDTGDTAHVDVYFPGDVDERALMARLEGYEEVDHAVLITYGPPGYSVTDMAPNDPYVSEQSYLSYSGFKSAWDIVIGDWHATIAVIDTGVDYGHEDFETCLVRGLGYDSASNGLLSPGYTDAVGHGTLVTGVAAAVAGNARGIAGAAHNVDVIPMRIPSNSDEFSWAHFRNALEYLEQLPDDQLPDVVNMSFSLSEAHLNSSGMRGEIESLIDELHDECGVVFVAAAGNLKDEDDSLYGRVYPAAFKNVLAVGNVSPTGVLHETSKRYAEVDLCALGVSVFTTLDSTLDAKGRGYGAEIEYMIEGPFGDELKRTSEVTGTSFSAPQVAAAAALVRAKNPDWEADMVESALLDSAKHVSGMGSKEHVDGYGYGRLDAAAAVAWRPSTGDGGSTTSPNTGGSAYEMLLGR